MNNKFRYTVTARPTLYGGTRYRSELEAAWAAFFDIRGINSEYEPALDLLSWKPDFCIRIQTGLDDNLEPVYDFNFAEVKPFLNLQQWKDSGQLKKIADSLPNTWTALLGVNPMVSANFIFSISPLPEETPTFEPLIFGELEDVERDWKRAKNAVQWRPSGN